MLDALPTSAAIPVGWEVSKGPDWNITRTYPRLDKRPLTSPWMARAFASEPVLVGLKDGLHAAVAQSSAGV